MYKAGQKLKLRTQSDLMTQYPNGAYFPFGYDEHMLPFFGREVTIFNIAVNDIGRLGGYKICIKEDAGCYFWHSSLFHSSQDVTEKVHDVIKQSFSLTL